MGTKKILSLCLAALMLFGMVLPASAAGAVAIEAATVTGVGTAGKKINVAVSATQNAGFVCGDLIVTYPADVFDLTGITFVGEMGKNGGTKITGQTEEDNEGGYGKVTKGVPDVETPGTYQVSIGYDQAKTNYTTKDLFTLEFTVKEGAALKSYEIGLEAVAFSFIANEGDTPTELTNVTVKAGSIELQEAPPYVLGDLTGDGEVDGRDLLRLGKYLAGAEVELNTDAADVNKDGDVDGRDLLRLGKYLAGAYDQLD